VSSPEFFKVVKPKDTPAKPATSAVTQGSSEKANDDPLQPSIPAAWPRRQVGVCVGIPALDVFLDSNGKAWADGSKLPTRFSTYFWGPA
jgi:hypothetical protein